jgi:outer membrane protein OmpA-like peptidoglycan-associated protein
MRDSKSNEMQLRFLSIWFGFRILGLTLLTGCAAAVTGLTPAQTAVLQQQGFQQGNDDWEFGFADKILFDSNSYRINPQTDFTIQHMAQALLSVEIDELRIEGHTDEYGTDAYNEMLSLHRAQVVAADFEKAGFLSTNIQVRGLGKQDPIVPEGTSAGQSENRRVVIIVPDTQ